MAEERTLSEEFHMAQRSFLALEDSSLKGNDPELQKQVKQQLLTLMRINQRVYAQGIISRTGNEPLDDYPTSALKFLLTTYYVAQLYLKLTDGDRLAHVKCAKAQFDEFLERLKSLKLVHKEDLAELDDDTKLDTHAQRHVCVSRMKRMKHGEALLKILVDKKEEYLRKHGASKFEDAEELPTEDAEELERNTIVTTLQLKILSAIDDRRHCIEEANMLKEIDTLKKAGKLPERQQESDSRVKSKDSIEKYTIPSSNGMQAYIIGPDGQLVQHQGSVQSALKAAATLPSSLVAHAKRKEFEARVLQPGYAQATHTVEWEADLEMQFAAKGGGNAKTSSDDEEEEAIRKEFEEDTDDAIRRAREWDEFKDDNPTGSGNRLNQG